MKAIVVHEFGGPEVLKLDEVPTPKPAAGQVLVRVHAVGVNPYDAYMRNGTYAVKPPLPYTPGSDGAGVIEAVGPGVTKVKSGDRVYMAKTVTGAYAEYAIALESQVHPLPAKVSFSSRCRSLGALRNCLSWPVSLSASAGLGDGSDSWC
jgi:NADPH2:quinone reductase